MSLTHALLVGTLPAHPAVPLLRALFLPPGQRLLGPVPVQLLCPPALIAALIPGPRYLESSLYKGLFVVSVRT